MAGGECEFLLPKSTLTLHPVAFGCRRCRGNEVSLHSHYGEGFALDWAINKNRHMVFGLQFTAITDCYALRFIFSYDGNNPPLLRLQMRLMCWDMTIVHRPGTLLSLPDYLSRLGADLCYDPMLRDYIQKIAALKQASPPVSSLPILSENTPGYRRKRSAVSPEPTNDTNSLDAAIANIITAIYVDDSNGHSCALSNVPVSFGLFDATVDLCAVSKIPPRYNSELVLAARAITQFHWAVYSFNDGHFMSSIKRLALPYRIVLAADAFGEGRALFKEFSQCPTILAGAKELYNHIRSSGDTSKLDGYLLHSHRFPQSNATHAFWQLQASIINELRNICALSLFVAIVHPDHDGRPVSLFLSSLKSCGWIMSDTPIYFPDFGDSVAGRARFIIGVHEETESVVAPCLLPSPPRNPPTPLSAYL
jgi:hypothetical protein